MRAKPMTINRYFEMVYLLISKRRTTAKELAEHFDVSTRTIYRNVNTLSEAGIPVHCSKGKNGGISLLDNESIVSSQVMSEEERDVFLIALQNLTANSYPESDDVLCKLKNFFNQK
ncbi:helix-turn-helix transcriptional regulator [Paenibacillus silvestris]|nr:HTH domain-containing protein [Paenibacillus silvestris]